MFQVSCLHICGTVVLWTRNAYIGERKMFESRLLPSAIANEAFSQYIGSVQNFLKSVKILRKVFSK